MPNAHYLPYAATRRFSPLVLDYLEGKESLERLYTFRPDAEGLKQAIEVRKNYPVDRKMLVQVLREQYNHLPYKQEVDDAIARLDKENTFTICTAHQPNLATGYLYFVYKILHAIKLAKTLEAAHPELHFVPVYYMGSEDADLDELGTFRFGEKKFVWDAAGQSGAVGRMHTASLAPLLDELTALFGPPGEHEKALEHLLREAYVQHDSIARATQHLVHELFGQYGLVVIDPDDARLKRSFIRVIEEDLLTHTAEQLVLSTIKSFSDAGYKAQAHPRSINLFYLKDNLRERIEEKDGRWRVLNTDLSWDKISLLQELHQHPERFSPNVMLRPLFQETILPNVAFIGGGAEVAYWLQLQSLFQHHKVFYPVIMLRQSAMWVSASQKKLKAKTGLDYEMLFLSKDETARTFIAAHHSWQLPEEHDQLEILISTLREKAGAVDPTLTLSADSTLTRMKHLLESLEAKMFRALKRKEATALTRIERLQGELFPGGGLAERVENFMPYYLEYGHSFFDVLLEAMQPLGSSFLIIEAD